MMRFLFFLFLLPITLLAQTPIPEHGGVWVHDEANVLSPGVKAQLEAVLKAERDSTSNQIAVLIVSTLNGEPLEDYSLKVAEKWKLGKKDKDNGVLLLIAVQDRKARIEVGLGNEGALTDLISNRIIRNELSPHFKQGDYDGGVTASVISIIQAIKGQYKNTDPPVIKRRTRSPWITLIVIAIIIAAASRRRGGGGGMGGYWAAGSILGSGMGNSSGSWGSSGGGDFGGGGGFGGGGSSGSW
jgi:uncharacterized protein